MRVLIFLLITSILLSSPSLAFYGARPMGMGGAFTAIANDCNAAYYNPAGFAINPGVDVMGTALVTNRNETIGDNVAALKMCFEAEMNSPFEWIIGVGAASMLAYEGAKYLSDQGVIKKNWSRSDVPVTQKDESMAEQVNKKGDKNVTSRREIVKKGAKKAVSPLSAKPAPAPTNNTVTKNYYYYGLPWPVINPWYAPNYRHPTYWDDRNDMVWTPRQKAQFALGLTWMRDTNSILDQNSNWYTISIATAWEETVSLGGNFNFYDLEIPSTKVKGVGAGFDVGALFRLHPVAIGIVANEVLTTDISWTNNAVTRYPMSVDGGIALDPINQITLAVDMHNIFSQNNSAATMHYGAEFRPNPGIALRAGLHDKSKTAGASIGVGPLILDYAYLGGTFGRTQILSLSYLF